MKVVAIRLMGFLFVISVGIILISVFCLKGRRVVLLSDNCCVIGGILKNNKGWYIFKTSFNSMEQAQKYKDMFFWIIKNDKVKTEVSKGYYDKKEE